MSSYKSFFNPTNMLVVVALLALILFRHSLFPEATESTEVKQLMGKVDNMIGELQESDEVKDEQPAAAPAEPATSQEKVEAPDVATADKKNAPAMADSGADTTKMQESGPTREASSVWQMARKAAWEGNSDAAIKSYRALIALQPDNYDAYGEMGNVMLQNGDTGGAVDAYSQAALLLGKSGYPQAAWQVMGIVARLDQGRAQELHKTLDGYPLPVEQ